MRDAFQILDSACFAMTAGVRNRTIILLVAFLFSLMPALPATAAPSAPFVAVPEPRETLDVPPDVASALEALLGAARAGQEPPPASYGQVLAFATANAYGRGSRILPERPEGAGVFYYRPMPFSLADLVSYTMDPAVPGQALYPNSVRRNAWLDGDLARQWEAFRDAAETGSLGSSQGDAPLLAHAQEFEEITPDETSGSYYAYTLNRLFALTAAEGADNGPLALFMVSAQNGASQIGLKGAVLGPDADWNYVYTGSQGSTLPMVGWAETRIDDAATINIWVEKEPGSAYLYAFKWLKAGWSGMNVVKTGHINAGINRYLSGLAQTLGSPSRPAPPAIAARHAEILALSDADQLAALGPYAAALEALARKHRVSGSDFERVLGDGGYARSLSRDDRAAELIRLYMKERLGLVLESMPSRETP